MIVFIKIINATNIESSAIGATDGISCLIEHLAPERQLSSDFPLEQPAGEPVIFVTAIIVLIYPITAVAISRPLAKTLLHSNRDKCTNVTCP